MKLEGNTPTYMTPPVGYLKPEQKGMVLEILKCLYRLAQSGQGWYDELHGTFQKLGFMHSKINHSVFIHCLTTEKEDLVIAVATDDMAITGNSDQAVTHFKNKIKRVYEITDLGDLCWFLGMEIKHDHATHTISINQSVYIEGMATKFGLTSTKPVYIPMLPGEVLSCNQSPSTPAEATEMSKIPYGNMIGHMLWPVMISHPDAVFTTGILSQFILNPGPAHIKALKCLISYLYTMQNCWLMFGGKNTEILTYTDADYAQQVDHHLISGYCLIFGARAISWSSKKQNIITLSSTEAEYVRHTNAVKEILWIRNFWAEINRKSIFDPILLKVDNQGVIQLSNNNKFHMHMKHINVRYHFIHEALENKLLEIKYVPTDENIVDIFTKLLSRPLFEKFRKMLGLSYT